MPREKKTGLKTQINASKIEEKTENVEKVVNTTTIEDIKKVNAAKKAPEKANDKKVKYACGCPVVEIGDGRIKAKCIKHGVE